MLQRALNILIDDAICYTPARGHITVEVSLQTKRVTIAARDDSSEVDISAGAVCAGACAKQGVKWANNAGFSLKDSSCSSFKTRRAFHGSVQRQHIGIPSIPSLPSLHYFRWQFRHNPLQGYRQPGSYKNMFSSIYRSFVFPSDFFCGIFKFRIDIIRTYSNIR